MIKGSMSVTPTTNESILIPLVPKDLFTNEVSNANRMNREPKSRDVLNSSGLLCMLSSCYSASVGAVYFLYFKK